MRRLFTFAFALFTALVVEATAPPLRAAITYSTTPGSIFTSDPTYWKYYTTAYIGYTANGSLSVTSPTALLSGYSYIGNSSNVTGAVTIGGTGSSWTNSNLYVGMSGIGTLDINSGGAVTSSSSCTIGSNSTSTGTVNVNDAHSSWTINSSLDIGLFGKGTLNITGGTVTNTGYCWIGGYDNASGEVTVDGPASAWTSGALSLGTHFGGRGTLRIRNGATVNSGGASIGYGGQQPGVATITGSGSTWTLTGGLSLLHHDSTLEITDGAVVHSACGALSGTATIDGTGSRWTADGDLSVDNRMNISGGAAVTAAAVTSTGRNGTINFGVGGGTLTTGSIVLSERPGQYTGNGTVIARGLISDRQVVLGSAADLRQTLSLSDQPGSNVIATIDMASNPTANGPLGAGWNSSGSLTIRGGITVNSAAGYIASGVASGVVTVTGNGSTWANSGSLYVGGMGNGTLTIDGGATVSDASGRVGWSDYRSTGAVTVAGIGTTWTNRSNLSIQSGSSTLLIKDGATVNVDGMSGSVGKIIVTGAHSTWNSGDLSVDGGRMSILDGAVVNSRSGTITGGDSPSIPSGTVVTVNGAGSKWTCNGAIIARGTLNIGGGGTVTGTSVSINSGSLLAVDVGTGSHLTDTGAFTNKGTVRAMAGVGAATTSYSPIAAGTWSDTGVCQGVGGKWNANTHQFSVVAPEPGTAGVQLTIDPYATQRVLITDDASQQSVGASFSAADVEGRQISVLAATVSDGSLTSLNVALPPSQSLVSAWNLSVSGTGYAANDPAYLSLPASAEWDRNDLEVWYYDGSSWAPFDAADLTCDGSYASFTVSGFGSYALTAGVPEPGTLGLLLVSGSALLAYVCRRRRR
ncbi:MAG: PEP-CTERM sorting domain-containing protein [Planctomycetaceae bacterium]|nr:PEP-CTERM sorting domain-containing protein [Planctomycetaceae bacterium]